MGTHRDVGPIIQVFRSFLRGRGWNEQLRRPSNLAPRPYPKPDLPDGPSSGTSANHYLTRDGRRMVGPPLEVANNITKSLSSGETHTTVSKAVPKPGNTYNWDRL